MAPIPFSAESAMFLPTKTKAKFHGAGIKKMVLNPMQKERKLVWRSRDDLLFAVNQKVVSNSFQDTRPTQNKLGGPIKTSPSMIMMDL